MRKSINDIENGLEKYPLLHWTNKSDKKIIEGTFIAHKSTIEIERYEVRIGFPQAYPYDLPWVIETGNKIYPRNASRHIFTNDTLCFGNHQDVFRICRSGITFTWFLDKILNPHLCREYVRDKTGTYPTGERSHGTDGTWEGYYDIFETNDKAKILKELDLLLTYATFAKNKECYCGSGKQYKRCHERLQPLIFDIGKKNVRKLYTEMKNDFDLKRTPTSK